MILIADSGSTNTDWVLLNLKGEKKDTFYTQGLNPYFHKENVIKSVLSNNKALKDMAPSVSHLHFYGAGCSSKELENVMVNGLKSVFSSAEIHVGHDLTAAAYACYDGHPGISCILGTGSNSCFFDGEKVSEQHPALAYILGDEASGSYFGKILLKEYFYNKLPMQIRNDFDETFGLTKDEIMDKIYNQPNANVFLASFMIFIGKYTDDPHVVNWVVRGMREFLIIHVKCYPNWKNTPTHFIGSVAYYFKHCLEAACWEEGVKLGQVIQQPIDKLVEYHRQNQLKSVIA